MALVFGTQIYSIQFIPGPSRKPGQWLLKLAQKGNPERRGSANHINQWLFLVPLIGGRFRIIPQLAVYTTYIPLIYCQLGDYMVPTTY